MDVSQFFGFLGLIALLWVSVLFQLPIIVWTLLFGLSLVLLAVYGFFSPIFFILISILYVIAAAFANLKTYRIRYITQPAVRILKKQMPPISDTEREAIEAGQTWWEKELFSGRPKWKQLLLIHKPQLSAEEQYFLDHQVEQLCGMLDDWQIVYQDHDLPAAVWAFLKQEKFFGMIIPKTYGGLGFSALAHSTVIVKIASRSISAAVNTMVPNSLGPAELLLHYGTDEQKKYYLPRLANGIDIPCFALTAPTAGSDAGAIPDKGVICRGQFAGAETIGIKISWDKRYITLAPIATVLGLAFHLYDPDHLLSEKEDLGITLCLIPTDLPGVELGTRHLPLLLAFMNGPTRGKDVFIPLDYIIGGIEMAGQGWRMVMESLSVGRSISLPALSTASAKVAYRFTGAYSKVRQQFNLPLSAFEGVDEALGYIAGYTYLLEACRLMTVTAVDLHIKPAIASAIAKYHMTEMARQAVMHAMDIHAGHMIQMGPRNFLGFLHIAMPISVTVEGANILTRNLIIFGQGAIRCHPYLLKEIDLITAQDVNINELDSVLLAHIGYFFSNTVRTFGYGLTGGKLIFSSIKSKQIKKYHRQLTRMSSALALLSDASAILLGGSLKRRERISARLGDVMSQLYLASAVIKYYHDNNEPETDVDYVCWCLQWNLYKIQIAIDELTENFPNYWIGKILHCMVFPFGRSYQLPADKLHEKIIQPMLVPSAFRDRITKNCYISGNETELTFRLEKALAMLPLIEPIWKKIHTATQEGKIIKKSDFFARIKQAESLNLITGDQVQLLMEYEDLKNEIIKVNEFSFDLNTVIA